MSTIWAQNRSLPPLATELHRSRSSSTPSGAYAACGEEAADTRDFAAATTRRHRVALTSPRGTGGTASSQQTQRRRRRAASAVVICAMLAASVAAVAFRTRALALCAWIGTRPRLEGGTCYVLLVTVWLLALLPTSLLEIAAGFIFGFWTATVCSTCGKVLGSFISFAIGRHYKDLVRERLLQPAPGEGPGYAAGLQLAMRARPFATCMALRLAYVPEAVQNYVPAVLDAPFLSFAGATLLGSSAYSLLWAKLGSELSDARAIAKDGWSPEKITFLTVGLCSLAAVFAGVHWNTRRMVKRFAMAQGTNFRDDDSRDSDDDCELDEHRANSSGNAQDRAPATTVSLRASTDAAML